MTDANTQQVGGTHYQSKFQHWDWVGLLNMAYLPAQVTKYLARWRKKNGLQDLKKSAHFLDKMIEVEQQKHESFLILTQNFTKMNELPAEEKAVMNMLVRYQLGDGDRLEAARAAVQRLIDMEEARLETDAKAAWREIDEQFATKENLNAP